MADNVQFSNTDISSPDHNTIVAADDIGGVKYQRAKLVFGTDGSATDVSSLAPLPVDIGFTTSNAVALNVAQSGAWNVTQSGSWSVNAVQSGSWSVNAVQSGTWNVGNITGTVSLPTGAATAAKQPVFSTAGNPSADVITIQGIASMTAVKVDGSAVTQPVSISGNQAVNLTQVGGATVASGHGTASGAIRVELPTDGTGVVGLAAGTNTVGKFYTAFQTTKALTNASVTFSASGDNTIVASTAAQTVRVHKLLLVAAAPVNVTLKDATAGNSLTGAIPLVTNGALAVDVGDGEPAFVSSTGGAFVANLSASVAVTGFIQYTKS